VDVYVCSTDLRQALLSRNTHDISVGKRMETITTQKHTAQDKISEIVDRVLTQIFGKEATLLIYKYLENNHAIRKNEISEKIDLFAQGLEEFLNSGALVIEKRILDDIYSSCAPPRKLELARTCEDDFARQVRILCGLHS